jgi:hypothetical protein
LALPQQLPLGIPAAVNPAAQQPAAELLTGFLAGFGLGRGGKAEEERLGSFPLVHVKHDRTPDRSFTVPNPAPALLVDREVAGKIQEVAREHAAMLGPTLRGLYENLVF